MSSLIAKKVIRKLMAEGSEALKDNSKETVSEYDMSRINENTPPSEIKKLRDAVARNRLVAPGLPQEELEALLKRIGH